MGAIKVRLVDSDLISNILKTLPRSSIAYEVTKVDNFKIVTTNVVENEVEVFLRKLNIGLSKDGRIILDLWKNIKSILDVRESVVDPSNLKGIGERSLVYLLKKEASNSKIVSNNRRDVLKILKEEKMDGKLLETPFEFYEEVGKFWFKTKSDIIKFMILANHDFQVRNKRYCGNILRSIY
ncbi:MAG: hypothetical protein QXO75_04260 [Nitrososphaerota archaeon]